MMKKTAALVLALIMACMLIPVTAEEDMTGEWYGVLYGVAVTMDFRADGTYEMSVPGTEDTMKGSYELRDGIVYMDGSTNAAEGFVYDGASLSNETFGVTFTRDPSDVQAITIAEVNPDAPQEAFTGEWTLRYLKMSDVIMDALQLPEEMLADEEIPTTMKIDGTEITITGLEVLFGEGPLSAVYSDGALTVPAPEGVEATFRIQMLEDGMAALTVIAYEYESNLWYVPAAAEEPEA